MPSVIQSCHIPLEAATNSLEHHHHRHQVIGPFALHGQENCTSFSQVLIIYLFIIYYPYFFFFLFSIIYPFTSGQWQFSNASGAQQHVLFPVEKTSGEHSKQMISNTPTCIDFVPHLMFICFLDFSSDCSSLVTNRGKREQWQSTGAFY